MKSLCFARCATAKQPGSAPVPTPRGVLAVGLLSALAFAVLVAGCASPRGIEPQASKLAPAVLGLGTEAAPAIDAQWWKAFGDPALDALVDTALAGNPGIAQVQARLARAAAGIDGARANEGPRVNGSFQATRQLYSENYIFPPPLGGSWRTDAALQATASWELDLFGRNRAALDAAIGTERAAQADLAAARVLLASRVASGWFQLGRLVELRGVAERTLAQREELLALTRQRVGAGLDTNVELRQSEAALPQTRQVIEALDELIALQRHALAALSGQAPGALDAASPRLGAATELALPAALPADLLGRRADVEAARWRVESATGDRAVARTDFYPNINLVAFAGFSSLGLDRLLQAGSQSVGIGPAIRLPIFDAGRLRAAYGVKTADLDAAVAGYNTAVLDALRDTADQLASVRAIERQQREQRAALEASESAYALALQRYQAGLSPYLTVLSAENAVLAERRSTVELKSRALDARAQLARALGGGYRADLS